MTESAAERYSRDWLQLGDDRKTRVDYQSSERYLREYVTSGVSAWTPGDNDN